MTLPFMPNELSRGAPVRLVLFNGRWMEIPDRLVYQRKWGLNHIVKVEEQWMSERWMKEGEVWRSG